MTSQWVRQGWRSVAGLSAAAMVVVALLTVGCGEKKEEAGKEKAKTSQVAAKVNGTEITLRQVDAQMPNLPADTPAEVVQEIRNNILSRLINDQLIVDKAVEMKLDRKPEVVDRIEQAKRMILAQAYFEQLSAGDTTPTESEVQAYYDKSSAEFEGNMRYVVRQVVVQIPAENAAIVRDQVRNATSVASLNQWLTQHGVRTAQQPLVIDTARLNPEMRRRLKTLKAGDLVREIGDNRAMITEVLRVESFPISAAAVKPLAEKELGDKRRAEAIENQVKQMRDSAKVEYMVGYAEPKSSEEIKAMQERIAAEAKAHQGSATEPAVPAVPAEQPAAVDDAP